MVICLVYCYLIRLNFGSPASLHLIWGPLSLVNPDLQLPLHHFHPLPLLWPSDMTSTEPSSHFVKRAPLITYKPPSWTRHGTSSNTVIILELCYTEYLKQIYMEALWSPAKKWAWATNCPYSHTLMNALTLHFSTYLSTATCWDPNRPVCYCQRRLPNQLWSPTSTLALGTIHGTFLQGRIL